MQMFKLNHDYIINSFYGLDLPSKESLKKREKKVAECIAKMGDNYVFAKKVERKK
jgi:hypothetical protein